MEWDGGREQRIERRIGQQIERGGEPPAVRPARPVRGRDAPDLARDQAQAAAVERAAERDRDVSPAPYQLSSTTVASSPASRSAVASPSDVPLAWKTRSHSTGASSGPRESDAERARKLRTPGVDIDERRLRARRSPAQPRDERADHAAADHGDPVGRPRSPHPTRR